MSKNIYFEFRDYDKEEIEELSLHFCLLLYPYLSGSKIKVVNYNNFVIDEIEKLFIL